LTASALAIMAKAPRAGEVKTRLCPPLTPTEAASLAEAFLLDRIEQVRGVAARPAIAYAPADAEPVFRELAPGFSLLPQRGPDLGARMAGAVVDLLADGGPGVVLVGTDSPTLPRAVLAEALERVARTDLVLGPSEDGGYYLIGLQRPRPELFADMAWSTADVLEETMRRARVLGLSTALLPAWFDVDTGDDLARLERELTVGPGPEAPHTRRYLEGRCARTAGASAPPSDGLRLDALRPDGLLRVDHP
jgi:rSAM/selenodomain-associated transferase 1